MAPASSPKIKIALLGCSGVGKSALVYQFCGYGFREAWLPTDQEGYLHTTYVDNEICDFEMIETSIDSDMTVVREQAIQQSHGVILVYDVSSEATFKKVPDIHREVARVNASATIVLVGNKNDAAHRKVSFKMGQTYARKNSCKFVETSAKKSSGVSDPFHYLVQARRTRPETTSVHRSRLGKSARWLGPFFKLFASLKPGSNKTPRSCWRGVKKQFGSWCRLAHPEENVPRPYIRA